MQRADRVVRPLAVSVSLLLHAALFVQVSGLQQPTTNLSEQARVTKVRLNLPAPTEPHKLEQQVEKTDPAQAKKGRKKVSDKPQQSEPEPVLPPAEAAAAVPDKAIIEDLRRRYIAEVMALIESHKFYPSSARRRRVEGDVQMSMMIDADGRPCMVQSGGAAEVLVQAARESLENTPIPPPPPGINVPLSLNFVIEYRLS